MPLVGARAVDRGSGQTPLRIALNYDNANRLTGLTRSTSLTGSPVVGTTSYGKGTVQQVKEFRPTGGEIKLTIARYFPPLGRNIDRRFNGGIAGFLGDQFNPFEVNEDPNAAAFRVRDLSLAGDADKARLERRYAMLTDLDGYQRQVEASAGPVLARDEFYEKAHGLITSPAAKRAFDAMMTMRKIDVAAIEAAVRGWGGTATTPPIRSRRRRWRERPAGRSRSSWPRSRPTTRPRAARSGGGRSTRRSAATCRPRASARCWRPGRR